MYNFHYEYIKNKFHPKLLFTDTGRLVYEIKTADVYGASYQDKDFFDFSYYPVNAKYFDPGNKKIIYKIKDKFKVKEK